MHSSESPRAKYIKISLLVLATLAVRIGILALGWGSFDRDDDSYGRLAINWARTGHYTFSDTSLADDVLSGQNELGPQNEVEGPRLVPTAYRPPMYPWMLSSAAIGGRLNPYIVAGMHVALGLATVLSVFAICVRLGLRWRIVSALAVACDPILLRGSQLLMTETLVTFLAVSAWLLCLMLVRPQLSEVGARQWGCRLSFRLAALLGAILGMAVLTRPTMLPWAIVSMLLLLARRTESGNPASLISTSLLFFLLLVGPWIYRNERMFDKPIATTTHGGYTLLLANNPVIYRHFRERGPGRDWPEQSFHDHWARRHTGDATQASFWDTPTEANAVEPVEIQPPVIDELSDDRLAQQAALATIRREPVVFALSCIYRMGWLWAVFPQGESSLAQQWAIGAWYSIWFLMALVGLYCLRGAWRSRVWLVPLLLLISLTAIHAVYWSNMRMRAPLMPVVYVVACWPYSRRQSQT